MEPFKNGIQGTWSHVNGSLGTIIGKAGWPLAIIAALVICVILARRKKKAPNNKKYSVSFAPEDPNAKRKTYSFEKLIGKLRALFKAAAESDGGSVRFGLIGALHFTVFTEPGGSISVIACTQQQLAAVYWEMTSILGRTPDSVWKGDKDKSAVLREIGRMASP